jgi:hypothetical protein
MPLALPIGSSPRSCRVPPVTATKSRPLLPPYPASHNCRTLLTKKYPHPFTPGNRLSHACCRPTLIPNHFPRRAMHHGCVCWRQRRREGAAGWWPTSPSSRWAGRSTTPASWPPTTSSICPATASPQDGGTAPAPPAWGCRAKHPWPGSRPCSRAATPRLASSSAGPMAATPCPPSTSCCGRPRASRSSTASGIRPSAGRSFRPITPGWPRQSPTWMSMWGPAVAMAVASTWPDRGC